jgi:hypothetical protein
MCNALGETTDGNHSMNNTPTQQSGVKYPHGLQASALRFDVADIFRKHIGKYKKTHRLSDCHFIQ